MSDASALARATELVEAGQGTAALDLLAQLPSDAAAASVQRARALALLGRDDDSFTEAQRAVEGAPDDEHALRVLAVAAVRTGQPILALEVAERARDVAPHLWETHHTVALAASVIGAPARLQANTAIAEALRLGPEQAPVHALHGRLLLAVQRPDEAVEAFDRALAITPDDTAVQNARAVARLARGAAGESAASFGRILAVDPGDRRALANAVGAVLHTERKIAMAVGGAVVFVALGLVLGDAPGVGLGVGMAAATTVVVAVLVARFLLGARPRVAQVLTAAHRTAPASEIAVVLLVLALAAVDGVAAASIAVLAGAAGTAVMPLFLSLAGAAALVATAVLLLRRAHRLTLELVRPVPPQTRPDPGGPR